MSHLDGGSVPANRLLIPLRRGRGARKESRPESVYGLCPQRSITSAQSPRCIEDLQPQRS
jgi:hypothetical protein